MSIVDCQGAGFRVQSSWLVRDVTFTAGPGELIALVGPNGAGKSTLLSLVAGDRRPDEGEVRVGGRPPQSWQAKQLGRYRAVMLQQQAMTFGFSVAETVAMGRLPHPADPRRDEAVVAEAVRAADLATLLERDVTTLSGGEGARAGFARVLAQTTPLVLLDEPTAALDLHHQEALLGSARALRDHGCCVIVVLHDLNLAARYADRVLVFAEGRLTADGTPTEVFTTELIRDVYHQTVEILGQPGSGLPLIVPVSGQASAPLGPSIASVLKA